ncbi:DUF6563 family protein [Prevotella sp. KH2C16]|uniref:DUF6563 family protein n=1 Tax=Prevotella sp. KH2C16 TaxID=1855325 RepID=UPI0008ED032A|nr:DUF6563 family protein [Prevotella sp. KH2C16]SFG53130.1 hypothetical protein SAMN05216383_11918 [Prevotella sp. KH2C16]
MKKRKTLGLLVLLLSVLGSYPVFAQDDMSTTNDTIVSNQTTNVESCATYEDFIANNWKTVGPVEVKTKSRSRQFWWGGKDFKFDSEDKAVKTQLKKETFAIMYADTLLLNTRFYKDRGTKFGNGYARALPMVDSRFIMIYFNVSEIASRQTVGGMFGLLGSLAVAASSSAIMNENVCYIITPGQNKALIIDDKKMKELMADKPDLLEKYMSVGKKKRSNAENVVPLLEEAGLIHRHNPVQ